MKHFASFFLLNILFVLLAPDVMFGDNDSYARLPVLRSNGSYVLTFTLAMQYDTYEYATKSELQDYARITSETAKAQQEKSTGEEMKIEYSFYQKRGSHDTQEDITVLAVLRSVKYSDVILQVGIFQSMHVSAGDSWYVIGNIFEVDYK